MTTGTQTEKQIEAEREFQRKCDAVVHQQVHYCVSTLVSELASNEKYADELLPVLTGDDWQSAAESGVDDLDEHECREELDDVGEEYKDDASLVILQRHVYDAIGDSIDAQEFCERHKLDPETHEALEHWCVSDWLAGKLEEQGEMVLDDFYGLTIWGRTTSGQSISMDGCIRAIVAGMK